MHVLTNQVLTFTNVRVFSKLKNKTRSYAGNFAPEAPFGTRGVGRMRKRDLSGPFRPLVGPGEARNATGTVTVTGTQASRRRGPGPGAPGDRSLASLQARTCMRANNGVRGLGVCEPDELQRIARIYHTEAVW